MVKTHYRQDERKNQKMIFGFVALFAAVAIIIGVGYAYFSDVITGDGSATAGTLDIEGGMVLYDTNGTAAEDNTIDNLNPGDILSLGANITNYGNKSAWVQTCVAIAANSELTNVGEDVAIYIYPGAMTNAAILADTTHASALTSVTAEFCSGAEAATQYVLDGTGTGAETGDAKGTGVTGNQLTANATAPLLKIYFDSAAGNEYQGKELTLTFTTKALQYQNNDTAYPTAGWTTVESTAGVNSNDTNQAPDVQ